MKLSYINLYKKSLNNTEIYQLSSVEYGAVCVRDNKLSCIKVKSQKKSQKGSLSGRKYAKISTWVLRVMHEAYNRTNCCSLLTNSTPWQAGETGPVIATASTAALRMADDEGFANPLSKNFSGSISPAGPAPCCSAAACACSAPPWGPHATGARTAGAAIRVTCMPYLTHVLPRVPAVFESEGEASFGRVDDVSDLGETKLDANSARMRELGFEGVGGVEQQNSIMDKLRDKGLNAEAASTIFHAFEQVGTKQIVGSLSPSTSLQ